MGQRGPDIRVTALVPLIRETGHVRRLDGEVRRVKQRDPATRAELPGALSWLSHFFGVLGKLTSLVLHL